MPNIREAVTTDAVAIAALLTQLGYPALATEIPGRLAAVAAAPGRVLVAENGDEVLGVASVTRLTLLHRPEPGALLSALVVRADHQGQGVGRALVEAAGRQAAAWGCATLELTSRDDRQVAHRFYAGLGFESRSRKFVRPVAGQPAHAADKHP
jgi:GNAT superfamily N-acetyltransferase